MTSNSVDRTVRYIFNQCQIGGIADIVQGDQICGITNPPLKPQLEKAVFVKIWDYWTEIVKSILEPVKYLLDNCLSVPEDIQETKKSGDTANKIFNQCQIGGIADTVQGDQICVVTNPPLNPQLEKPLLVKIVDDFTSPEELQETQKSGDAADKEGINDDAPPSYSESESIQQRDFLDDSSLESESITTNSLLSPGNFDLELFITSSGLLSPGNFDLELFITSSGLLSPGNFDSDSVNTSSCGAGKTPTSQEHYLCKSEMYPEQILLWQPAEEQT